jgi:general stress protein 26
MMDPEIRKAFWKDLADSPYVMLRLDKSGADAQPMRAMLDADAHHKIWFFMHRDNGLSPGGAAKFDVAGKGHKLFAAVTGTLSVENDRAVFENLWSDKVAAWFKDGKDSPSILLMRFDIADSQVWQVDMTIAGLFHLFTGTLIQPDQAGHYATGAV